MNYINIESRKKQLYTLQTDLNVLREREAKYAGNAPLELLNQINDHVQAIELIQQAIAGHLLETDLEEALSPLLLAIKTDKSKSPNAELRNEIDRIIRDIQNNLPDNSKIAQVLTQCLDLCSYAGLIETYGLWINKELEGYIDVRQFAEQFPNKVECRKWLDKWASYRLVRAYIKSENIDEFTGEPYIQKLEISRIFIGDDITYIAQRVTSMKRQGEIEYPIPYERLGQEYSEMRKALRETSGKDLPRQTTVFFNKIEFEQILNKVRNLIREILSQARTQTLS